VLLSPVLPFLMAGVFMSVVAVLKDPAPPHSFYSSRRAFSHVRCFTKLVLSGGRPRTHVSAPKTGAPCRLVKAPGSRPLGKTIRVRSLPDSRGWAHVRLVDVSQPVGRDTDREQRVQPDPTE
jgi:hypothetical protein